VRGLLITNPRATSMTGTVTDLAVRSLGGLMDVDVERTSYRGHARELAAASDADLVIVLGGDGSVNEVVNGLLSREKPPGSEDGQPAEPPLIAVIPGGGGNVLARALGLPVDSAAALRRVAEIIAAGRYRTIGLGLAGDRYFTFSAGLGLDAEVIREVDRQRALGRRENATLYLRTMVRQLHRGTDRRTPALTVERDGQPPMSDLFTTIVTNRSPWTYFRNRPLLPVPTPDFSSGLDVLGMRRIGLVTINFAVAQMLWVRKRPTRGRELISALGLEAMTIRSARPIAFQVDGEYLGETEAVEFRFVPHALRVVA
jgi:diacylglycerol kinase family enzyme